MNSLKIHHIAMRTDQVETLASFYETMWSLRRVRKSASSIWLQGDANDPILMIELRAEGEPRIDPGTREFLAFTIRSDEKATWRTKLESAQIAIEDETAYTLYFRDPDGRRIGVSHYPD